LFILFLVIIAAHDLDELPGKTSLSAGKGFTYSERDIWKIIN